MEENFNPEEEQERLRIDNEIKKMKLKLEHGSEFDEDEDALDPHIEAEFLENISRFEEEYKNRKKITIFNLVGRPGYKKAGSLAEEEIKDELDRVMKILKDHNINLDTICKVDDRLLYTFITEELFPYETDDIRIEGLKMNFIYEEFHPNHEIDIQRNSIGFIKSFLDKEDFYYRIYIMDEFVNSDNLEDFRESFEKFTLNRIKITSFSHDEIRARVDFEIDFTAETGGRKNQTEHFLGPGYAELYYDFEFWSINKVIFPESKPVE